MTTIAEMPAGFADKVLSAQSTFRSVMDAMARPGSVQRIEAGSGVPAPMMRGSAAIALTLFDQDTPVWLDAGMAATPAVAKWIKFHTSAPVIAGSSVCSFALIAEARTLPGFEQFSFGTSEYPDRSTTIILQVASLTEGPAYGLRGPGIDGTAILHATIGLPDWLDRLALNATLFPRGIDLVLVSDDRVVAIPRTTRLTAKEG
ncbi:phosphonate C-P lyase system protein PhnH [Tardiphaga sp. vice352]|uniref:phosphonate C-P lyase system protein PhnH n=1 Tax=unclassified Tardiphaga TaxID=2631404 RepID=UPI001165A187|nr:MULTISPECIES: phosphonate C-P lyase system protein PhnH [unclassified Tardiphaga]MBC7585623.1 phosphonate C-P lyase system protein PhnH [Tardiphaga sp.]QDM16883.1 phosphonate C-P lyase system protein PhnH [Tardiphaga sp. vice278]QDM21865.1 phosphonate C-P lyase system protein PhnH [Tardiphaga sp. vice154]QDM27119.1 phosphonate C-P lyase system protein PhnH [Tardiphaga sp. vice304]QDM32224.1 phosphonate C-P lyase system protein PhnH [Tardiphaga sp. vice352]